MRNALAVALAASVLAVPVAGAQPDSYQPQLRGVDTSDVVSRALDNRMPETDVVDRAVARHQQESSIPVDSFDRAPLAERPSAVLSADSVPAIESSDGLGGLGLVGALALAATIGAAATVLTPVGRRSLAHR
jgi:hypothetical protein